MKIKQRFFPELDAVPQIFPYGRVSHASQLGDRDARDPTGSLTDQNKRMADYIEYMQRTGHLMHGAQLAGLFLEPKATSASSKPFRSRPQGKVIMERILPGDHLVVDKFDRLFRDQYDYHTMRRWFGERGITVHFVEFMGMSGTMNSRAFRMILSIKAIFAEDEAENTSERICLARSSLRATGKDDGAGIPFFMKFVSDDPTKTRGHTGHRQLADWALPLMEKVVHLMDVECLGRYKTAAHIFKQPEYKELKLTDLKVRKLYRFYKAWDGTGRPDVSTLKVNDFVKAWWERQKENAA